MITKGTILKQRPGYRRYGLRWVVQYSRAVSLSGEAFRVYMGVRLRNDGVNFGPTRPICFDFEVEKGRYDVVGWQEIHDDLDGRY